MWLLIFIGAYVCASANGETPVFRKCCSRSYSLISVSEYENEKHFDCLDRVSVETTYNISNAPLIISHGVIVESGMPESCDGLREVNLTSAELNGQLSDSTYQCYDRLVLEIVNQTKKPNIPKTLTLSCIQNETEKFPDINLSIEHIRKCCPKGQIYDPEFHLCRHSDLDSSEQWVVETMNVSNYSIYAVENGLHCKADEYGVELSEDLYSMEIEGSSLRVLKRSGEGGGLASPGQWCVDREYGRPGLVVARVCTRNCSAYGAYCVRKCCPVGEHFRTRRCGSVVSTCVPNDEEVLFGIDVYINPLKEQGIGEVLGIRAGLHCSQGKVALNRSEEQDYHYLLKNGDLKSPTASNDDYCFESFDTRHCPGGDIFVTSLVCFIKAPKNKNFHVSFVLITISSVCLALTLLVYCSLPELRNLHGRTLICHVSMMLLAFCCLARVQFSEVPNPMLCTVLGYGIYFGFVAAFAWLNVMCLDIWWTFGSMRSIQPMRKAGSDRRRFLWYSLYAWSITILLTLTMFLLDRYPVARYVKANIGTGMCWFGSTQNSATDWPHYIFFVIPMGIGTCTNLVLFTLTARHCARVKSEVHRMQAGSVGERAKKRFRVDRANYVLTGKLWVVMGAGWISELLSTIVTRPEWLWSIVDLCNELQGVFIFLILIFKPKLYYLIRKRLGLEKPDQQKQGTSSYRTSSTFLSRTISLDDRATLRISQGNNVKQP